MDNTRATDALLLMITIALSLGSTVALVTFDCTAAACFTLVLYLGQFYDLNGL